MSIRLSGKLLREITLVSLESKNLTETIDKENSDKQSFQFDSSSPVAGDISEVEFNGKKYTSTTLLAQEVGYDLSHIGRLARQGKLESIRHGKKWMVHRASLLAYKKQVDEQRRVNGLKSFETEVAKVSDLVRKPIVPSTALFHTAEIGSARIYPKSLKIGDLRYVLLTLFVLFTLASVALNHNLDKFPSQVASIGQSIDGFVNQPTLERGLAIAANIGDVGSSIGDMFSKTWDDSKDNFNQVSASLFSSIGDTIASWVNGSRVAIRNWLGLYDYASIQRTLIAIQEKLRTIKPGNNYVTQQTTNKYFTVTGGTRGPAGLPGIQGIPGATGPVGPVGPAGVSSGGPPVVTSANLTLDNVVGNGNSTGKLAFFNGGIYGGAGSFSSIGVSGAAQIGDKNNTNSSVFTVFSKNLTLDATGNVTAGGTIAGSKLLVSGNVLSDFIPSGSFNLGSASRPWNKIFLTNGISGLASASAFYTGDGTAASPSFSFGVDKDTGIYRVGLNTLGFSAGGSHIASASNGIFEVASTIKTSILGSDSNLSISPTGNLTLAPTTAHTFLTGTASVSSDFEIGSDILTVRLNQPGVASISLGGTLRLFNRSSVPSGSGSGSIFYDTSNNTYKCFTTGWINCSQAIGAGSAIAARESNTGFASISSLSFDAGGFNVSFPVANEALVKLDYTNGPASRAMANTWTALNTFSAIGTALTVTNNALFGSASVSNNFELGGTASISGNLSFGGSGTHTIQSLTGSGALTINAFTLGGGVTGNSQNVTGLNNASGSGTFEAATGKFNTLSLDSATGVISIANNATASLNFEVIGYASASRTYGSGLATCTTGSTALQWDSTTGKFSCANISGTNPFTGLAMHAGVAVAQHITDLTYEPNSFAFSNVASAGTLRVNWGSNGIASRSTANTWMALNTFNASPLALQITGNASASQTFEATTSIKTATFTGDGAVTLQSGGANILTIDTG